MPRKPGARAAKGSSHMHYGMIRHVHRVYCFTRTGFSSVQGIRVVIKHE